ncbi:hypothetical protein [Nocardioides sp.]|uniref:hypothetical protein n=1 Tax=Nocardioides sp. TaxID=35761 RepID=UPI002BDE91E8|nr:hypothetical protein [Nocardioides sp.]HXH77313.1 hypothetical protein [Nocardioides sp.]
MSMLTIEIDDRGPREHLDSMIDRLLNPRPMMTMLGHSLEEYEREVFRTRGFRSWAPDDADTVEQKGDSRVLVDTGQLLRQLTSARVVGDTVVVDQGDAFYAGFLRDGKGGMPRRDPAPKPSRRHVERWADQVLGYIVTGRTR